MSGQSLHPSGLSDSVTNTCSHPKLVPAFASIRKLRALGDESSIMQQSITGCAAMDCGAAPACRSIRYVRMQLHHSLDATGNLPVNGQSGLMEPTLERPTLDLKIRQRPPIVSEHALVGVSAWLNSPLTRYSSGWTVSISVSVPFSP